jgi:hypothetical protein
MVTFITLYIFHFYSGFNLNIRIKRSENEASNSIASSSILDCEVPLATSESQIMLQNIKEDFFKLNKRFYSIPNDKNEKILLEFEEEYSRLIYRIDDVEPINEHIKQSRKQLIQTIQGMIGVVRERITQVVRNKVESSAINFEAFLPNANLNRVKIEPMDCEYNIACPSGFQLLNVKMPQDLMADDTSESVLVASENASVTTEEKPLAESYKGK